MGGYGGLDTNLSFFISRESVNVLESGERKKQYLRGTPWMPRSGLRRFTYVLSLMLMTVTVSEIHTVVSICF